jgi:CHAT domain-containing protein/tetratricopeptide (TPR) repeat protein
MFYPSHALSFLCSWEPLLKRESGPGFRTLRIGLRGEYRKVSDSRGKNRYNYVERTTEWFMRTCTGLAVVYSLLFLAGMLSAAQPQAILLQADHFADLGDWDKARDLYAQAEQEFHARGDMRNEFYAKFGRLHRDVQSGSYTAVLRQVETDLRNPVVAGDPSLKIRALALKGTIDLNVDTAGAEEDFSEILVIAKSAGDQKWMNRASGELGIVAGLNGDLGTAAVALTKAISTAEALHDIPAEVNFSVWLANGMSVHGMADRALHVLDGAFAVVQHDQGAEVPIQLSIAKIRALANLPASPGAPSPRAEAKRLIEQTLIDARRGKILGAQTELLNQAGLLARGEHDLGRAETYFSETAEVAQQADLPRMRGEALLHLCELYREQGRLPQAMRSIDDAIAQQRRAQEPYDLPIYLSEKAEVEATLGRFRTADSLYNQATYLIEAMLVNAPSSRVKSSMIATMGEVYVGRFKLAATRLHNPAKAFGVVEAARGRTLADSLRYSRDTTRVKSQPVPAELEITRIQKRMMESSVSPAQARRLLGQLDEAYNLLVPVEYKQNREEMKRLYRPTPLARVQKSLRPGEALIEYVLDAGKNSYALEVTHNNIRVHAVPPREEIDKLVHAYVSAVKTRSDWKPLAHALFDRVLAPAMSSRPTLITIIPDGSLHLIPFASLLDERNRYTLESRTITSAPSATVFYILRTADEPAGATKPFLGVAFGAGSSVVKMSASANQSVGNPNGLPVNLPPLPYAVQEVNAGAHAWGEKSVLLLDDHASETALKAEPLKQFKVIHIAAHGVGNMMEPGRAGLVLAPGSEAEDGFWQAREIRRSRLAADVVTLSACETGVGRLQGEEGIMNLARSFLVAGAKSVVASLWAVDDRSTATLMEHFYRHIAEGEPIAEALRMAQKDMLLLFGKDAQPYYWAEFTVIGDGTRKISLQTDRTHYQATR